MIDPVYMPNIITVKFPEGDFDFIWCEVCAIEDGEPAYSYEAFVGLGVNVEDMTKASDELSLFDVHKVFTYVPTIQDFFYRHFVDDDFIIHSYERDERDIILFDYSEWDDLKNDPNFWGSVEKLRVSDG